MYGRRLRSQLDNIRPDLDRKARLNQDCQKQGHNVRSKQHEFQVGDLVYDCNYGQGPEWLPGKVISVLGAVSSWRMAGVCGNILTSSEVKKLLLSLVSHQRTKMNMTLHSALLLWSAQTHHLRKSTSHSTSLSTIATYSTSGA